MVFARSAAMAFNRYLDRNIDASNPRTANVREIPKGIISANNALWFVIINVCLFIASSWFINTMCFYLSPLALLVILGYSYTKRFTPLCHFVLGVGLALAPIGAYLAITAQFHFLPVLFSFLNIFNEWYHSGLSLPCCLYHSFHQYQGGMLQLSTSYPLLIHCCSLIP